MLAYCYRGGVIEFADDLDGVPSGTIVFAQSDDPAALRDHVSATARHAYDGQTFLVPGLPESVGDNAADPVEIFCQWLDWAFQDDGGVAQMRTAAIVVSGGVHDQA